MADTREQIVMLVQSAVGGCSGYWAGLIADNLIANGVRLERKQSIGIDASDENKRWIPVAERLPDKELAAYREQYPDEEGIEVLVMIKDALTPTTLFYNQEDEFYDVITGADYPVTHWRPMPAPPKG